jgi:glycosyltransferase involved in cell wall biosynthesis
VNRRSPVRVCIVMPSHWSAKFGGAELQVRLLAERLVEDGRFELHFVAANADPAHRPAGYALHRLPSRRRIAGQYLLHAPALARCLHEIAPDVLYQRVGSLLSGVAARYSRVAGRPLVWHVASDNDLEPAVPPPSWRTPVQALGRRAVAEAARQARVVVVQTRAQAERLAVRHGRRDAVHVPNFHPLPEAVPAKPADRVTICWLGNLKALKRPELFLRLARDLRDEPGLEFVMAGALQMPRDDWATLLARETRPGDVHWLGAIPPSKARELLGRAHVLVNTSRWEGFPNTFIESWLRDVAVASLAVDPDGVLETEGCGFHAHGDYAALRDGVRRLARDPAARATLVRRAAEHARAHHSPANLDRLVELLHAAAVAPAMTPGQLPPVAQAPW